MAIIFLQKKGVTLPFMAIRSLSKSWSKCIYFILWKKGKKFKIRNSYLKGVDTVITCKEYNKFQPQLYPSVIIQTGTVMAVAMLVNITKFPFQIKRNADIKVMAQKY